MSSSMVDLEVILLGEVGVGKTTLFLYLDKNKFVDEQTRSTVGVDIMYKTVRVDDRELTVKVDDTGGNERFRTLTSGFYRRANVALLIYSVEDAYTLDALSDWIKECSSNNEAPESLVYVLIGNKIDLGNEIDPNVIEAFCKNHKIRHFYAVSCRTGESVNEMFEKVVKDASEKIAQAGIKKDSPRHGVINVGKTSTQDKKQKKCC